MSVIEEIAAERRRQVEVEGWTTEHDDLHRQGELARAGAAYAYATGYCDALRRINGRPAWWPFENSWWKPKDRRSDLIRAGALIVAEVERLDRAAAR